MAHSMVELALIAAAALAAGAATTIAGVYAAAHDHTATDPNVVVNPVTIMAVGMASFLSLAALVLAIG